MSIIDAILLGLIQGLTEFIPVSSSGHLILLAEYSQVNSSFAYDVLINIGTLGALVIYFRGRIAELRRQLQNQKERKLLINVIISTIPAVIVGGLFADIFASDDVRNRTIVTATLLIVGVLMVLSDKFLQGDKKIDKLKPTTALQIGLAQALALIPGTSRSGATMLAGRAGGLSYGQSAEYSFLIAIPILTGAILRSLLQSETIGLINDNWLPVIVGISVAFVSGLFAIDFMIKVLREHGLKMFGYYRIILALALLLVMK